MEFFNFEILANMAALFGIEHFRNCQLWGNNMDISREVGDELVRRCKIQIEKEIAYIEKYHSINNTTGAEIHPAVLENILSWEDVYTIASTVGKATAVHMIDSSGIMGGPSVRAVFSRRGDTTHAWLRLINK